jgi:hypothetical protein
MQVLCRDWKARLDAAPGKAPTLYLTGTCDLPTPGHRIELIRKAPQGFNPRDLLLDKVITPPTGVVAQVITPVEVRYEEKTDFIYDTVTILPDGATIRVEKTN